MNERVKQLAEDTGIVITTKGMEDIVDGCYIVSTDVGWAAMAPTATDMVC